MEIKELINLMKHHISDKIIDLSASGARMDEEQKIAAFWCGRQTATWAIDLIESAKQEDLINLDEMTRFTKEVMDLNRKLSNLRP